MSKPVFSEYRKICVQSSYSTARIMQIRKKGKSSCKNIDEWNKRNEYILQNISGFIIVGI